MDNDPECKASVVSGAVGQASCGIVHDLANVLQTILLRAEVTAATENVSPTCAKRLEQIVEDSKRCADAIRGLLEHARRDLDAFAKTDLGPALREGIERVRAACPVPLSVDLRLDPPMSVRADPSQVADLVAILGKELLRETQDAVTLKVSLRPASEAGAELADALWMEEAQWVLLTIERMGKGSAVELDDGALPDLEGGTEQGERHFDLLRVKGIVRQHRGQIHTAESVDDAGQTFTVHFVWPTT